MSWLSDSLDLWCQYWNGTIKRINDPEARDQRGPPRPTLPVYGGTSLRSVPQQGAVQMQSALYQLLQAGEGPAHIDKDSLGSLGLQAETIGESFSMWRKLGLATDKPPTR